MSLAVRIIAIILVMVLLSFAGYYYMKETTGVKEVVVEEKFKLHDDLLGLSFADDKIGWAVGRYGTIIHTTDGGENWEYQKSGTEATLLGVDTTSVDKAWIVGKEGTVLSTADRGKTWKKVTLGIKDMLCDIQFFNAQEGWIVGEFETVFHTTNGGTNWERQHGGEPPPIDVSQIGEDELVGEDFGMEEEVYTLNSVYFLDSQLGWAAGEYGTVMHTKDGGATWVKQDCGTENTLMDVEFVRFKGKLWGFVVGLDSTILKSLDGGETWTKEKPSKYGHYYGVTFRRVGPSVVKYDAFAVGQGIIAYYGYLRNPALQNWMPPAEMKTDISYDWLSKICFISESGDEAIAVGEGGIILRAPAGGHEWYPMNYPRKNAEQVLNP